MNLPRASSATLLFAFLVIHASGDILYETSFEGSEGFTPGADNLAGTDGWLATNPGEGLHGIDEDGAFVPGLGQTAYLGFFPPSSNGLQTVSVFRPLNFDPIAEGKPIVEFEALIDIADSRDDPDTNPDESLYRDRFLITVYNKAGQLLASIIYDNRTSSYGLWRSDGSGGVSDTGFEFIIEEPQFLFFTIDFENNTWSASLDGAPLFTDAQFNATGNARDLGTIAAEWDIRSPRSDRKNWMLFDEWYIAAKPRDMAPPTEPFCISKIELTPDGTVELTYPADQGCTYRIQYSTDLTGWLDLPDSPITASESNPIATHLDSRPVQDARYYRIIREEG